MSKEWIGPRVRTKVEHYSRLKISEGPTWQGGKMKDPNTQGTPRSLADAVATGKVERVVEYLNNRIQLTMLRFDSLPMGLMAIEVLIKDIGLDQYPVIAPPAAQDDDYEEHA